MKHLIMFEDFANQPPLLGQVLETGYMDEVVMTQQNLDCVASFLSDQNIEATPENIELLVANLMPGQEGEDAFNAGLGFDISEDDFDSWEDVRCNFTDVSCQGEDDDEYNDED